MIFRLSKSKWLNLWPLLLLLAVIGLLLSQTQTGWRYGAALALLAFLPGWVWLQALFARPAAMVERLTLAIGLSLALTISVGLAAVYLPGAISQVKIVTLMTLITLLGIGVAWRAGWPGSGATYAGDSRMLFIMVVLLLLAAALRLPRLGYAEFHEDEAEALMLGARLLNGEDYALFLHRKGPAQMLLPLAFWLLAGQISEAMARFPFALSSLFSVATIFLVGRRWFGGLAGVMAALLWAINGYAIGFGRMVQYQALIFFLGPLALYCLYLAWVYQQPRWQLLGAFLLAICLLAHFDALLLLPAAIYLGWLGLSGEAREQGSRGAGEQKSKGAREQGSKGAEGQRSEGAREQGSGGTVSFSPLHPRSLAPLLRSGFVVSLLALIIFLTLLAAFYVPYMLDPEFSNTAAYLSESRVKPGLLYNNLNVLQRLDQDYSSRFYLPLLGLGLVAFVVGQSKSFSPRWRWVGAGLGLLLGLTVWLPNMWRVGDASLAVLPWLALLALGFWFFTAAPMRAAWLMFGATLVGYVFLIDDPRTHLYIIYPGAVLLAGVGWSQLLGRVAGWQGSRLKMIHLPIFQPFNFAQDKPSNLPFTLAIITGMLLAVGVITYDAVIFLQNESTLNRLRDRWAGSLWEVVYDELPPAREYFGYPKREGWKAIGALRAQGRFPGDFRSVNEDFVVPIWYNYGQARSCYNTPAHFFARVTGLEAAFAPEGYGEIAQIAREQKVRLRIFSAGAEPPAQPVRYELETLAAAFDRLATPQQFTQQSRPKQPVETQFGPAILFLGYDLESNVIAPGQTLHLNLYWRALENPGVDYRAFVHLTDGTTLWGQQDDNPVCRLPTSIWRAGQEGLGQFRLLINPDTPLGRYPLIIGLYQAETLERLTISGGAGQRGDNFLWLGDIEVREHN